jgi:two-component system OmpR family sensor kinase
VPWHRRHRDRHPHEAGRHGGPPWHHHGPPWRHDGRWKPWAVAHGVHRRLVRFVLLGAALGAIAGSVVQAQWVHGHAFGVCAGFSLLLFVWPLAWAATFTVVRPLRQLAKIGDQLRSGELAARDAVPDAPDEVGAVADAMKDLGDRVARQLADQRALLAAVSHELRSPLGRARVLVAMAREGSAPDDWPDAIDAEIDGMDALVGDLLAASRIDFEAVSTRALPPSDVARRAVEAHGHDVTVDVSGDLPPVRADATLLVRALGIVLDNARRYGGVAARLSAHVDGDVVVFDVTDDGPGLPDVEAVFQPFWRGPGERAPGGVGLGLSLVRRIAEAHGGSAGAENLPSGGARVWLTIPRAISEA